MGKTIKGKAGGSPDALGPSSKKKQKKVMKLRPGLERDLVKLHRRIKDEQQAAAKASKGKASSEEGEPGSLTSFKRSELSDARKSKFARALASTDWHTRERALRSLELWLSGATNVSAKDLKMVWKGLFYCFWHSDKTPVQQELAQRLSNLVSDLKPLNVAVTFWETFLDTMAREWSSIDRLRLDKFMSLVRMFMHSTLKRMSNENWHPEVVVPMWDPLGRTLQRVNEGNKGHVITGLALHISHVFLDELEQVCINAAKSTGEGAAASSMNGSHEEDLPDTIPADVLSFFVEPFRNIMCTSNSRAVVERVVDSVYNKLVRKCVHCLTAVVENDDTEKQRNGYPFVQLEAALMAQELFDIAADPLTNQFNRDKVYDVIGRVEKLAEFQNSYQASLDQNANQAQSPKTPTKSKRSRKDKERVKLPKRGVVFQLKNNQVFKFHKKQQPKVTYSSVNSPTPTKGALKLKSKWPEVTRRSGTKKRR